MISNSFLIYDVPYYLCLYHLDYELHEFKWFIDHWGYRDMPDFQFLLLLCMYFKFLVAGPEQCHEFLLLQNGRNVSNTDRWSCDI